VTVVISEGAERRRRLRCGQAQLNQGGRIVNGFSDASIDVPDARRYSRTIGLIWCESEYGTPGSSRSISLPSASS